jgi:hypothetical protein
MLLRLMKQFRFGLCIPIGVVRGNKELPLRLLLASELVAPRIRAFVDFLVVLEKHPEAAGVRCPGAYRVHDRR